MFFDKIFTQRPWAAPFSLERSDMHEPTNPIPKRASLRGTDEEAAHRVGGRAPNFGIIDKGCPDQPLLAVYGPDCPDTSNLPLCNEGPTRKFYRRQFWATQGRWSTRG